MFPARALRTALASSHAVFRNSGVLSRLSGACSALCPGTWTRGPAAAASSAASYSGSRPSLIMQAGVRHYTRVQKKKPALQSQLSDLPPTMLKMEYAAVPISQTTDDIVKRLISLELASHSEKLQLKKEQLIAKVQLDEHDRSSVEVKVAILTARIRNYQEHLQNHHKDKSNKRRMLMAMDCRKKLLKNLRVVNYEAFQRVCHLLGITYTSPPQYYRHASYRWLAKKAFCIKVFKEVQKQKAQNLLKSKKTQNELKSEETRTTTP